MYIIRTSKYFVYLFIIDIIAAVLSFSISVALRFHLLFGFDVIPKTLLTLLAMYVLALCCVNGITKNYDNFFNRGNFQEVWKTLLSTFLTTLVSLLWMFFSKTSGDYSRAFVIIFIVISTLIGYLARIYFKFWVRKRHRNTASGSKVMVITVSDKLDDIYSHAANVNSWDYSFTYVAVIDKDMSGEKIGKLTIEGTYENMYDYAKMNVVDEVLVNVGYHHPKLKEIIKTFEIMGITCHIVLNNLSFEMANPKVESFSGYSVLTTSYNSISHFQLIEKRMLDIVGSVFGLIFTGILSIFIVPIIKLESPGPAIYSQERVGRNGRRFKIYKFRSMYTDADERKKELMKDNKMDGLMFKMDDDPRITKIGKFIRKTSIDEFPQFWNVFKGDMSLVGTRPPTVDEFEKYEYHHKNRLSFKPGLTGLWQVSGRSDITDFEEVVQLDTKYIENWSFMSDIKILFQTALAVVMHKGSE